MPVQEAAVGFRNGGTVVELNVRPGDVVRTEQVLARLDDTEARTQLAQAETNLRLAQHKLDEADTIAAQAEANLQLAELKLDQADNAIAQAEANLHLAELKLDTLLAGPTDDEITVAVVDMEQAAVTLKQAQTVYDTIPWADDVGASPQAAALQTASLDYEKSLATYRQKVAGATPDQIAAVQAKLTQAQQQYDDLLAGVETNDVAAAQIAVEQAQAAVETARDIAALEIGVKQARAALAVARDTTASEIGVEHRLNWR